MVGAFAGLDAVTGGRQVARCRTCGQNRCQDDEDCHGMFIVEVKHTHGVCIPQQKSVEICYQN